jgi:hypothetical protein
MSLTLPYENIILHVGTNDVDSTADLETIIQNFRDLILAIVQCCEFECRIFLSTVLPHFDRQSVNSRIKPLNKLLLRLADEYNFVWCIPMNSAFLSCEKDTLARRAMYAREQCHLAQDGIIALCRYLHGATKHHINGGNRPHK